MYFQGVSTVFSGNNSLEDLWSTKINRLGNSIVQLSTEQNTIRRKKIKKFRLFGGLRGK